MLEAGSAAAGRDGGGGDVAAATSDLLDKVKGFGDMIDKVSEASPLSQILLHFPTTTTLTRPDFIQLHPYAKCAWGVLSVAYQVRLCTFYHTLSLTCK